LVAAFPRSGSLPASAQISVKPAGLGPGVYHGTVTATVPNALPTSLSVPVTFTVVQANLPKLGLDTQNLSFPFTLGGTNFASASVSVRNSGGGSLAFSAATTTASGGNWLSVSPASGTAAPTSPVSLTITVSSASLRAGTYSGTVIVTNTGSGDKLPVTVNITVTQQRRRWWGRPLAQKRRHNQRGPGFYAVVGPIRHPFRRLCLA
jgi:hypothetical protein